MDKVIDYYYSLISPWTYLGGIRFEEVAARHEATVNYKPMKLSEVFPATGGLPLAKRRRPAKLTGWPSWSDGAPSSTCP